MAMTTTVKECSCGKKATKTVNIYDPQPSKPITETSDLSQEPLRGVLTSFCGKCWAEEEKKAKEHAEETKRMLKAVLSEEVCSSFSFSRKGFDF